MYAPDYTRNRANSVEQPSATVGMQVNQREIGHGSLIYNGIVTMDVITEEEFTSVNGALILPLRELRAYLLMIK